MKLLSKRREMGGVVVALLLLLLAVTPAFAEQTISVADQVVTREHAWRQARGVDVVTIVDSEGQPVEGALVVASFTGPNEGEVEGVTGSDGTVVLTTPWTRYAHGTWCFTVTNVILEGATYDPDANAVTTQCEGSDCGSDGGGMGGSGGSGGGGMGGRW